MLGARRSTAQTRFVSSSRMKHAPPRPARRAGSPRAPAAGRAASSAAAAPVELEREQPPLGLRARRRACSAGTSVRSPNASVTTSDCGRNSAPGVASTGIVNQSLPYGERELDEQQAHQLVRVALDAVEVDAAVLELPPAVGGHARVAHRRGDDGAHDGSGFGSAGCAPSVSAGSSVERVPLERAARVLGRRQRELAVARRAPRRRTSTRAAPRSTSASPTARVAPAGAML